MCLEFTVFEKLKQRNFKISVAESVTGGKIVDELVNVHGISEFLQEAYLVYSNESKIKNLNVSHETIEKNSVVSEAVVSEMLDGLQLKSRAEVCVATSGYAENEKVSYFGIKIETKKYIFGKKYFGSRNEIRNCIKNDIFQFLVDNL